MGQAVGRLTTKKGVGVCRSWDRCWSEFDAVQVHGFLGPREVDLLSRNMSGIDQFVGVAGETCFAKYVLCANVCTTCRGCSFLLAARLPHVLGRPGLPTGILRVCRGRCRAPRRGYPCVTMSGWRQLDLQYRRSNIVFPLAASARNVAGMPSSATFRFFTSTPCTPLDGPRKWTHGGDVRGCWWER